MPDALRKTVSATEALLVDPSVYPPKLLDEVGRCKCCKRKPLVYKRTRDPRYPRGHFCSRCNVAYSLESGVQIENWAWRAVNGGFQGTAKRQTSNPAFLPSAPRCRYCNDTGMIACRSRDGQYAFAGPVPDDAKGYFDADCWYCDSGRPPKNRSDQSSDLSSERGMHGLRDTLPAGSSPANFAGTQATGSSTPEPFDTASCTITKK